MKIVLDTNVLASGIFWGGIPQKVLEHWGREEFQVLASELILEEYLRNIQKLALKLKRPDLFSSWALILPTKIALVSVRKNFKLCRDPKEKVGAVVVQPELLRKFVFDTLNVPVVSAETTKFEAPPEHVTLVPSTNCDF
jgi:putative PIN family toxin of toxin-antitoxin system